MLPAGKVRYRFLRDKVLPLTFEPSDEVKLTALLSVTPQMEIRAKTPNVLSLILHWV